MSAFEELGICPEIIQANNRLMYFRIQFEYICIEKSKNLSWAYSKPSFPVDLFHMLSFEEDDWLLPTPVQADAIPLILGGGDVLAAAETGSGKTGAFGLPCLQIVHEQLRGKCVAKSQFNSNLKCELNLNDKDMFVLVTEDGLECKSDDAMRLYSCALACNHPLELYQRELPGDEQ